MTSHAYVWFCSPGDCLVLMMDQRQISFVPARERVYKMSLPIVVKALSGAAPDFRDAGQIGEEEEARWSTCLVIIDGDIHWSRDEHVVNDDHVVIADGGLWMVLMLLF